MGARPSSFVREPEPEVVSAKPKPVWSAQQEQVFDWFRYEPLSREHDCPEGTPPLNLVVRARAGTGKTTTIIEGVNRAPEEYILVTSFGRDIVNELKERLENPYAEARTLHGVGHKLILRSWKGIGMETEDGARALSLTETVLAPWEEQNTEKVPPVIKRMISHLHTKLREMCPLDTTLDDAMRLALQFGLLPDEGWGKFNEEFVTLHALAAMIEASMTPPSRKIGIDHADQIYLPLAWNLTSRDYDLVVVDEAQDMTLAQLELAQRVCRGRMCIVGDDRQAIYGFRGADTGALDRLKKVLKAAELPLTVTYRCRPAIVQVAQRLVPDLVADPSLKGGVVDSCWEGDVLDGAEPGDFILSRTNAPLVHMTLNLLKMGKRARMAGRDIGKGLKTLLHKLHCEETTPLEIVQRRVQDWEQKTSQRQAEHGDLDLVAKTHDEAEVIYALIEHAYSTAKLLSMCEWLFTNEPGEDTILCSTVHKAKGKEADRVYVLVDTLYRKQDSQNDPEEQNIEYVAVTRAKRHLTLARFRPAYQ